MSQTESDERAVGKYENPMYIFPKQGCATTCVWRCVVLEKLPGPSGNLCSGGDLSDTHRVLSSDKAALRGHLSTGIMSSTRAVFCSRPTGLRHGSAAGHLVSSTGPFETCSELLC